MDPSRVIPILPIPRSPKPSTDPNGEDVDNLMNSAPNWAYVLATAVNPSTVNPVIADNASIEPMSTLISR